MDILANISTNFNYKKDAKNSQFSLKFLTVYYFVFFLYKKTLIIKHKKLYRRIP